MVQMPPQQSEPCAHTSPFCVQYEPLPQVPPALQKPEQHVAAVAAVHGLPSVLHDTLSGVHVPLHLPLQHSPSEVHVLLSAVHLAWHMPETQLIEQQSVLTMHEPPVIAHKLSVQVFIGPHLFEQH
jgi:hypothetical protein